MSSRDIKSRLGSHGEAEAARSDARNVDLYSNKVESAACAGSFATAPPMRVVLWLCQDSCKIARKNRNPEDSRNLIAKFRRCSCGQIAPLVASRRELLFYASINIRD